MSNQKNHIVTDKKTGKKYPVTGLTFGNEIVIAEIGKNKSVKFKNPGQRGNLTNPNFNFE